MVVKLDSKRRLTLPKGLVAAKPGDTFEASFDADEEIVFFRRVSKHKKNWLQVLKNCPVPMDDLPPRSREMFQPKI